MSRFLIKVKVSVVFCFIATQLLSQDFVIPIINSSISTDSVVNRIVEILKEYNETVIVLDTSEYIVNPYPDKCFDLQVAATRGDCNKIIKIASKLGDISDLKCEEASPLHYAISNSKSLAAELLVLLGAPLDKYDLYGNTPLIAAIKGNDLEISEMLVRYGATVVKGDLHGVTPLHYATALGLFYMTDMLLYYEVPTDLKDEDGNTPLMVSSLAGYYDITDILLKAGADPNAADNKGFTPLMAAAQNGDTLMMRLLIDAGANLYSLNKEGFDALCVAVKRDNPDAVRFLLKSGNRWDVKINNKKNATEVAALYGNRSLVPLLRESGFHVQTRLSMDEIRISAGAGATPHYYLFSGSISLRESGLKSGLTVGAYFNPVSCRLLMKYDNEDILYQYKTKTSILYAGIFKEFNIYKSIFENRLCVVTSLSAGYSIYSRYNGTRMQPDNKFIVIPAAGLEWKLNNLSFYGSLSWIKTPFYKVPPAWFSLGCNISVFNQGLRTPGKRIKYLSYE